MRVPLLRSNLYLLHRNRTGPSLLQHLSLSVPNRQLFLNHTGPSPQYRLQAPLHSLRLPREAVFRKKLKKALLLLQRRQRLKMKKKLRTRQTSLRSSLLSISLLHSHQRLLSLKNRKMTMIQILMIR